MNELNISAYIKIMQIGFMAHDKQEAAAKFILNSINGQIYVINHGYQEDFGSKKISLIVNRKAPVPDGIKKASAIGEVIDATIGYFNKEVVADLNPHVKDDVLDKLSKLIEIDKTISDAKRKSLLGFYQSGDEGKFLGETFLYSINKPNKKEDNVVEVDDAPLLAEANYECPLCHDKLLETVKGKPIKRYVITQIFPEDISEDQKNEFNSVYKKPHNLDSPDNLIALCERCSEEYLLAPTIDEYKKIHETKSMISRNYKARISANNVELEENIRVVLNALINIKRTDPLVVLEYDALRIEEKIPNNYILKDETINSVLHYYRYIESVFSESDADFDEIASEVKVCSQKFEKSGMSQDEVVFNLAEWIRNKTKLEEKSRRACGIVVAFFIQNCEVFHK